MDVRELAGPVTVAASSVVGEQCVLGCPKEARVRTAMLDSQPTERGEAVWVGERCILYNQVVIYEGSHLGDECVVEDRVRIGYGCTVGPRTRLVYGAYVCDRVRIGADARVAGFVCDGTVIGDRCTVMGELVHEYTRPHQDWWEVAPPSRPSPPTRPVRLPHPSAATTSSTSRTPGWQSSSDRAVLSAR